MWYPFHPFIHWWMWASRTNYIQNQSRNGSQPRILMNLFFLKCAQWQSNVNQWSILSHSYRHDRLLDLFYFSGFLQPFIPLSSIFSFLCCSLLFLLLSQTTQRLSPQRWVSQPAAYTLLQHCQLTWASAAWPVSAASSSLTTKEGKSKTKQKSREALYRTWYCQPGEVVGRCLLKDSLSDPQLPAYVGREGILVQSEHISPANEGLRSEQLQESFS